MYGQFTSYVYGVLAAEFFQIRWLKSEFFYTTQKQLAFQKLEINLIHESDLLQTIVRSSDQKGSVKQGVLKNFTNFTGKHLS